MKTATRDPALARAIELLGGPAAVARALGIATQAVSQWKRCPPARARALAAATGNKVKDKELCPHVFGEAGPVEGVTVANELNAA